MAIETYDVIVNHTYKVSPQKIDTKGFRYETYDCKTKIGVQAYKPWAEQQIPIVIKKLNEDINTRQAVLVMNRNIDFMSCLMCIQWQMVERKMYVTVTLRSQAEEYRKKDSMLWNYLNCRIIDGMKVKPTLVDITVNVGNYHKREKGKMSITGCDI